MLWSDSFLLMPGALEASNILAACDMRGASGRAGPLGLSQGRWALLVRP